MTSASRRVKFKSQSELLEEGLALIRSGEFFAAHEILEDAWRAADAGERDFFQGLVHVAVAWYQAARRNTRGCERQLAKAERRLASFAPEHQGIDVAAILREIESARSKVEGGSLDLASPRL